jgi:uncharacterized membrane protein YagU involved in acid resistance
LNYIASALLGKAAYTGGTPIQLLGLFLHYAIAFTFTLFFFWLYPKSIFFRKSSVLTGIIYGAFIWAVMNLLVVPASRISAQPFNPANAAINLLILIVCIGLPLSFIARRHYKELLVRPITV